MLAKLEQVLTVALDRGTLSAEQANALRDIEAHLGPPGERTDNETLRFITGFADIFVTIGIGLFEGALGFLVAEAVSSTAALVAVAVMAWVLAELFTARRRMALPSIVLLVVFVAAVFGVVLDSLRSPFAASAPASLFVGHDAESGALAALVAFAAAVLHYWRFLVPITIAAGAGTLTILVVALAVSLAPDMAVPAFYALLLICGLAVFAVAMRFDLSDPARATRRSDIAFWLHLLAAPLIVHSLLNGFVGGLDRQLTLNGAWVILAVFLSLALVAIAVDRRAILVSGLIYAGVALGKVGDTFGLTATHRLPALVVLALGDFILILSAGWHMLRGFLLRVLPKPLARRLPHPLVIVEP